MQLLHQKFESTIYIYVYYVHSSIRCTPGPQLSGVHSVLVSVDEQLAHARISSALRHSTMGLISGT